MEPVAPSPVWNIVYAYVIPVLLSAVLGLVGWVAIHAARWVGQKVKESRWFAALDFAQRWAFDALLFAGSEFRTEYQKLVADGELSADDRKRLRDFGVGVFKKWLDARKTKMLQEALGLGGIQFDQFISSQVEKAIVKLPSIANVGSVAVATAAAALAGKKPSETDISNALTPALGIPVTRP